jgi:adenylate cyclase class 2
MLEVEQKFRVDNAAALAARLSELGVRLGEAQLQIDRYFNHPARDFGETDEALRIRQAGQKNYVTYKGPKLDSTTKTRREIDCAVGDQEEEAWKFATLLEALGFKPVAEVRKQRRTASMKRHDVTVTLALDEVEGLGSFVELECVLSGRDPLENAKTKAAIALLATELGLTQNERKSYLELLLQRA